MNTVTDQIVRRRREQIRQRLLTLRRLRRAQDGAHKRREVKVS